ncbi:MAG: matrixin family metalloprotease [Methylobacteriaceae bacterium]|nr:matrixin family metalloprotease [Methylobacteriaceae bacterium]
MADYELNGPHWTHATITWSIDSTIPANEAGDISTAFARWASVANLHFNQVAAGTNADIEFSQRSIDGANKTLGQTTWSYSGTSLTGADVVFDQDEGWSGQGSALASRSGASFTVTALHEIGHALGLGHYNASPAVMNAVISSAVQDLTASDIHGIQALYGAPPTPAVASAPTANPYANALTGPASSFTHGSFDPTYYLAKNPDVAAAAGADGAAFAWYHYSTYGWHEGRNPNAVFDTRAYLATYGDVRSAGLEPLQHYDDFGWHEGRDPAAGFDTRAYLAHNPDVAAAGLDPLQHFLAYGIHEGRLPYGDGVLFA